MKLELHSKYEVDAGHNIHRLDTEWNKSSKLCSLPFFFYLVATVLSLIRHPNNTNDKTTDRHIDSFFILCMLHTN